MKSRRELPQFLNDRGLIGPGAEIGVQNAKHARAILEIWKGHRLYLIDPWRPLPNYIDPANATAAECNKRYCHAKGMLGPHLSRVCILRMLSCEAAKLIKDNELDWIHIDARHTHKAAEQDLYLWWPKVRLGGLFSGHDYYNAMADPITHVPIIDNALPSRLVPYGVKGAVDDFAVLVGKQVNVTVSDHCPTWWWIK